MKNTHSRFRIVLFSLALCTVATVGAQFSDVDSTTMEGEAIEFLFEQSVVNGNPDGTFSGEAEVNRAEAAKMLLLARGIEVGDLKNSGRFSDIPEDVWFRPYVMQAANRDILQGYAGGTFLPGNSVNTAEFLKMLTRTFELPETLISDYQDVPSDAWFAPFAGVAKEYELFPYRTKQLDPAQKLTRNEVAVAIFRVMADPEMVLDPEEAPVEEPEDETPEVAKVTLANSNTNPMLIMTNAGKVGETAMSLDISTDVPVTITSLQFRLEDPTFFDTVRVGGADAMPVSKLRVTVPANFAVTSSGTVLVYVNIGDEVARGESEQLFLERVEWMDEADTAGFKILDLPGYELMGL